MDNLSSLLIGQPTLQQLISGFLKRENAAGSYLVHGPEGAPIKNTAIGLAHGILCRNPSGIDPCGECDVCKSVNLGKCLDLQIVEPEGNWHKIESLRQILEQAASYPWQAKYKVFIIQEAHKMRLETADSLLKSLEEPPSFGVFILATSNFNAILPTIVSRCQGIRLGLIPLETIKKHLIEKFGIDHEKASTLARVSMGKLELAEGLASSDYFSERTEALDFIDYLAEKKYSEIYPKAYPRETKRDIVIPMLFDKISLFRSLWRDLLLLSEGQDDSLLTHVDLLSRLRLISRKLPSESWKEFCEISYKCEEDLLANLNVQQVLDKLYFSAET